MDKKNIAFAGPLTEEDKRVHEASFDMSVVLTPYEEDLFAHIKKVQENVQHFNHHMTFRYLNHDLSKFSPEEKEVMEKNFDKLRTTTYGSDEYKQLLKDIKPALDYHYSRNDHHPEHFENGVNDMDLFQLVEMFCDWKAAIEKHDDGDIMKSLEINRKRFGLSDQLYGILVNTVKRWDVQ